MDQMVSDSNCCVDRRASIFDHRLGGIYLALGSVNRFTGRFAAICSTFKPNAGTIPDAHSHSRVCTEGNTRSYPDNDAVAKSSPYASASSDSSPPPPIASPFLLSTRQRQSDTNARRKIHATWRLKSFRFET